MPVKYIEDLTIDSNPENGAWVDDFYGLLESIAVDIDSITGTLALKVQQEFSDADGNTTTVDVYTSGTIAADDVLYPSRVTEDSAGDADARTLIPLRSGVGSQQCRWRIVFTGATAGTVKYWVGLQQ